MNETLYIAATDIEADTDCMVFVVTGRGYFIAAWNGTRLDQKLGRSTEALPKGRLVQKSNGDLSLFEDTRIYRVPFTIT